MTTKTKIQMSKAYKIGYDAFYARKGRNESMPADWLRGWDDACNTFKNHPDMDFFCEGAA